MKLENKDKVKDLLDKYDRVCEAIHAWEKATHAKAQIKLLYDGYEKSFFTDFGETFSYIKITSLASLKVKKHELEREIDLL